MIGDEEFSGADTAVDDPPLQAVGPIDFRDPKKPTGKTVPAAAKTPRHIEQALAEQANDAISRGADPKTVGHALSAMVKHLRANPDLAEHADDAISRGADEHAISGEIYRMATSGDPAGASKVPAAAVSESTAVHPAPPSDHSLMDDLSGGAGALAQGASLGQAKRLAAGAIALKSKITGRGPSYDDAIKEADKEASEFHGRHPYIDTALRMGGGAAAGAVAAPILGVEEGAAAAAPKALSLLQRMKTSAATGFDLGALGGAITADGSLADRARGGIDGSVIGAGAGAALPVAGTVVSGAAKAATPLVNSMKEWMMGGAEAAPMRAGQAGAGAVNATPGVASPSPVKTLPGEGRATDVLLRRATQSGVSLDDAKQAAIDAAASGKPITPMEVFGQPVQRLGRYVSNTPSAGSAELTKSLDARGMATPSRIMADAEGAMGAPRENLFNKADALMQTRRANAAPLYEKAYAAPPVDDPEVLATMKLPAFQAAFKRGARIAKTEGIDLPPLTKTEVIGGEPVTSLVPQPVQSIDYMKRGLDDLIDSKTRSGAMGRTEARALRNRLSDMLGRVDDAVPEYAQARSQFAGDSKMMEALENGQDFLNTHVDQMARDYPKLSDGEQDMYRVGALGAIRDKVLGTQDQRDLAKTLTGTPDLRARLQTVLGDGPELQKFMKAMEAEKTMAQSRRVALSGSDTFRNAADQADVTGQPNSLIGMMISAHPGMAVRHAVGKMANSAAAARLNGVGVDVADALAPKLSSTGSNLVNLIDQMIARSGELSKQAARNQALAAGASTAAAQVPTGQP